MNVINVFMVDSRLAIHKKHSGVEKCFYFVIFLKVKQTVLYTRNMCGSHSSTNIFFLLISEHLFHKIKSWLRKL